MKFTEAVSAATRTYSAKARDIVPFYFFIPSTLAIARVVPFIGVAVAAVLLQRSGALAEIEAVLADAGPISLDDPAATNNVEGVGDSIGEILAGEPLIVSLVLLGVLSMYVLVPAILWVSAAGRLHGIVSVLTDPRGTAARVHFGNVRPPARSTQSNRSAPQSTERPTAASPLDRDPAPPAESADRTDSEHHSESTDDDPDPRPDGGIVEQSSDDIYDGTPKSPIFTGTGNRPLRDAVDGTFTHALTFIGLLVLELLAFGLSVALFGVFAVGGPAGIGLYAVVWLLVIAPGIRTLFAFAKPAAVVEETGTVGALRGAGSFMRAQFTNAFAYGLASLVALIGIGVAGALFAAFDAGTLAGLLLFLLVLPFLDILKTTLYADYADEVTVRIPDSPTASPLARLRAELGTGWGALKSFSKAHPGLIGINVALFGIGGYAAWVATAGIDGTFEASIENRVTGNFPPGMAVEYFSNNWSVGIAQSFSGVAFGIPSAMSVLLNGFLIGAFVRFEVALAPFVAFVIPHGLIEIPALWLSGALGLYLGVVGWRTLRGRIDRATLTDEIEYAYKVTMGLAVLFALAALIEAFFSPYYWRLLGI